MTGGVSVQHIPRFRQSVLPVTNRNMLTIPYDCSTVPYSVPDRNSLFGKQIEFYRRCVRDEMLVFGSWDSRYSNGFRRLTFKMLILVLLSQWDLFYWSLLDFFVGVVQKMVFIFKD